MTKRASVAEWKHRVEKWEGDVRRGQVASVRDELLASSARRVPEELASRLGSLAWRSGAPELGARILAPLVRDRASGLGPATPAQIVEYAACLVRLGGVDEAEELLRGIAEEKSPRVLLVRSFVLVARWDYAASIPLLRRYLRICGESAYERLVVEANLAAALVYERQHLKAEALLQKLLHTTSVRKLNLLLGVALELTAANLVLQRRGAKAMRFLEKATEIIGNTQCLDAFFIAKWSALARFVEHPARNRAGLSPIRAEATKRRHWETVRDIDRHVAVALGDVALFHKVYFGTPFPSFREALRRDFPKAVVLPVTYTWSAGGKPKRGALTLDVDEGGVVGDATGFLKPGQLVHRTLVALGRDLYRPARVAALHGQIYPGEHFNPVSSWRKVHEALRRLRIWFSERRLPLDIVEDTQQYRLSASGPVSFLLREKAPPVARRRSELDVLAALPAAFSSVEAARALGVPLRSAQRILGEGVRAGALCRAGRGRSARYRPTTSKR